MTSFLRRLTVHERASEAMVGILVSLGARGAYRITSDEADPWRLVVLSLAATLTWAILDAVFALLAAKGHRLRWAHLTDDSRDPEERGHEWTEEALGHSFLTNLDEASLAGIRRHALEVAAKVRPESPRLTRDDWLGGLAVFATVLLAGIPAVVPLLLVPDPDVAAYASYGVVLALMALLGAHWGPAHGLPRAKSSLAMLALGTAMVAVVLLFGG